MQTTINEISLVEYELEITATADDLAPEIDKALRAQRARTSAKGFRPGKVPLAMVKKMHGRALAYGIAEQSVQQTFEAEVLDADDYDVIGQPTLTTLEYELDGDLRAVVRFGVRPEVELKDLSNEKLSKLVHTVTDEEVDEEIEQLRRREADLTPVEEAAGESDQVTVDLQRIDEETGTPIIGEKEEDVTFFLDEERVHDALKEGLLGKKPGDAFRADLPHGSGEHVHTHRYEVTLKEVKRRELPDVDDAFISELTDGKFESVEAFRAEVARQLQDAWDQRGREVLEGQIVERMLALHPVPVPSSAVDMYLDSFVEDVKQQRRGELPEDFDEEAFRQANRGQAEQQARWMLIRDRVIEEEGLAVTDEDRDRHFEETSQGEQFSPAMMRQYYEQLGLMERVEQRLLSEKVFGTLAGKFDVEEQEREDFEEAMKERQARKDAPAEGAVEAPLATGSDE